MTNDQLDKIKRTYRRPKGICIPNEIAVINGLLDYIESLKKLELMHALKKLIDEYDSKKDFMPCRDLTPVEFELYKVVKIILEKGD
jgi:hypothetical protein